MHAIPYSLTVCLLVSSTATAAGAESDGDAVFRQLDRDSNGVLKRDEIDQSQEKAFQRLLRVGDKDANGELTLEEYRSGLTPAEPVDVPLGSGEGPLGRDGRRPPFDGERLFQMADRNADGKLTLEELPEPLKARLAPLYERLGRDALTKEDLTRIQARIQERAGGARPDPLGNQPPSDSKAEKRPDRPSSPRGLGDEREADGQPPLLRVLDIDQDGRLSREEFANLGKKFSEFDLNGDDRLDLSELARLLKAGPRPNGDGRPERPSESPGSPQRKPGGDPEALLKRFDRDQDGFVSKDEAPEPMQRGFDRIDQDGDGRLSVEEIKRMGLRNRPDGQNKPKNAPKKPDSK